MIFFVTYVAFEVPSSELDPPSSLVPPPLSLLSLLPPLSTTPHPFHPLSLLDSDLPFVPLCSFLPDLVLKKMRPSRWIPFVVISWGIVQTFMGMVTNYTQLLALRALLGFFECGLFPGLSFYLSSWYPRKELGLRIALFFSAATLAGVSQPLPFSSSNDSC